MKSMFISAEELEKKYKAYRRKMNREVKVEDGYVGFPKYDYWIELDDIKTHAKAIHMIMHLGEKNWVTKDMLLEMLRKVHNATGLELYGR